MCRALPGVTEDIKWGHDLVFSIGGRMFAVVCLEPPHTFSFKCTPEEFAELIEREGVVPAPYLARAMWVQEQEVGAVLERPELAADPHVVRAGSRQASEIAAAGRGASGEAACASADFKTRRWKEVGQRRFQRAAAAARAISRRRFGESAAARAGPPLMPPSLPRAAACGLVGRGQARRIRTRSLGARHAGHSGGRARSSETPKRLRSRCDHRGLAGLPDCASAVPIPTG